MKPLRAEINDYVRAWRDAWGDVPGLALTPRHQRDLVLRIAELVERARVARARLHALDLFVAFFLGVFAGYMFRILLGGRPWRCILEALPWS